jgi:hypothetical protein
MYTIEVQVEGTAPLMQHRFPMPTLEELGEGGKIQTGAKDYTQEWREYFYTDDEGNIYQPASHFEGSMVKAAVNFKITGKRGKTYKDLFKAAVFVTPEAIPHGVKVPDELTTDGDAPLYLDMRPVVVQRSRVVRIRPTFKTGWKLEFNIEVVDDQIPAPMVNEVLALAGT